MEALSSKVVGVRFCVCEFVDCPCVRFLFSMNVRISFFLEIIAIKHWHVHTIPMTLRRSLGQRSLGQPAMAVEIWLIQCDASGPLKEVENQNFHEHFLRPGHKLIRFTRSWTRVRRSRPQNLLSGEAYRSAVRRPFLCSDCDVLC